MEDGNPGNEKNDFLGELDYVNSCVGLAKSLLQEERIKKLLTQIQNDLFLIQRSIAYPEHSIRDVIRNRTLDIQNETSGFERNLKKIDHFILPEGITPACICHFLRVIFRNIERKMPGYAAGQSELASYFDKIACLMFSLARKINQEYGFEESAPEYAHRSPRKEKI